MSNEIEAVSLDWLKQRAAYYRDQANSCEGAYADQQYRDLRRMAWACEFVHEIHLEQLNKERKNHGTRKNA